MKLQFDPENKEHKRNLVLLVSYATFGMIILEFEAWRQVIGSVALGLIIISTIIFKVSTSHRLKVMVLCVWVTEMAFLFGYCVAIAILE